MISSYSKIDSNERVGVVSKYIGVISIERGGVFQQ